MKSPNLILVILVIFSLVLVSFPQIEVIMAESKTIIVPNDYISIQEAIDNADEGDTIFVKKGNYDGPISETLIIDKAISLIGEGSSLIGEETTTLNLHPLLLNTTIFGQPYPKYNTSLIVKSNNVTISGFTIKIPSPPSGGGGEVSVIGNGTQIVDCIVNTPNISLQGSCSTITTTYLFISNLAIRGSNQTITKNILFNGDLEITSSFNNIIENDIGNEIRLNGSYNLISGNSFYRIFLEHSDSNTISNNNFSCIWLGIYGHTCSNNTISGNILDGGYIWGILMGDGFHNVFYDNIIKNFGGSHDGYGVAIGGNHLVAENNTFYHNIFLDNNKNVGYNWDQLGTGNFWDNGIEGNYWDDYTGIDANGDGIGDTPYIIDDKNQDNFPLMKPPIIPEFHSLLPEDQSYQEITIRTDGSIEPDTNLLERKGNTYTFKGDIFGTIMVQKGSITIDGAGYTIQGKKEVGNVNERGIYLVGPDRSSPFCRNVIVKNLRIFNFWEGIFCIGSSNNSVIGNYFENAGIHLLGSPNYSPDLIKHNIFNGSVIFVDYNTGGTDVITENNFFNGYVIVGLSVVPIVERNYWSDYNGTDSDGDGIGDTPYVSSYVLDETVQDNYPLMTPLYIEAISEFASWFLFPLLIISTLVMIIVRNKIRKKGLP
jgi:nitrous oxidase accessory protein